MNKYASTPTVLLVCLDYTPNQHPSTHLIAVNLWSVFCNS